MQTEYQTASPAQNPEPPQAPCQKKVRRVGTFTLGILLVAAGAALLAEIFLPGMDIICVLKYAPAALICLGIEVLIYAVRPGIRIQYDTVSILLCLVILAAGSLCGVIAAAAQYLDPKTEAAQHTQLRANVAAALDTVPEATGIVRDFSVHTSSDAYVLNVPVGNQEVQLYVTMMPGVQGNAAAFAADCQKILNACREAELGIDSYYFDTFYSAEDFSSAVPGCETWTLQVDDWGARAGLETLTSRVDTSYYYDDIFFDTEEEMLDYRQSAAGQRLREQYVSTFGREPEEDYWQRYHTGDPDTEQLNRFMTDCLTQAGVSTAETAADTAQTETTSQAVSLS